jgi:hypothetical protein
MTGMELRLAMRRGENLLVTLVIPVVLLVFLANVELVTADRTATIDLLVPSILALAVLSTGMVALGISTAFERSSGVLKRLGGSPAELGVDRPDVHGHGTILLQVRRRRRRFLLGQPPVSIPSHFAAAQWLLLGPGQRRHRS